MAIPGSRGEREVWALFTPGRSRAAELAGAPHTVYSRIAVAAAAAHSQPDLFTPHATLAPSLHILKEGGLEMSASAVARLPSMEEDKSASTAVEEEEEEVQDVDQQEESQEQAALLVDAQLRAMAVSSGTTRADTAPSTATSTGTRSAGESFDDFNGKKGSLRAKPLIRPWLKPLNHGFESGSGSGDQDGMVSMEDGVDVAAKKRKTRRGKPKHRKLKPYSKQQFTYHQRLRCRAVGRLSKTGRQPPAPYNTTQFLMEDHNDLPDLDEKIAGATIGSSGVTTMTTEVHSSHFSKPLAPPRTRDSSFSVDSEEDYFYSSPEDEEEFLTKEFSSAYEDLHAERLGALSKTQLIQEYIQLEAKVDLLTKRLRSKQQQQQQHASGPEPVEPVEQQLQQQQPRSESELAKKLKLFQQRVEDLLQQNDQLRRENELLRKKRHGSPMSSVDSESDSDSSSSNDSGSHKQSPGSSPVPTSYHARRDKTARRKNSSVSSVDSESDSTTGDSSYRDANSPQVQQQQLQPQQQQQQQQQQETGSNGHAASHEIDTLPT